MSAREYPILFIIIAVLFYSSRSPDKTNHIDSGTVSLTKVDSVVLEKPEPLFGKFVENFWINDGGDICQTELK